MVRCLQEALQPWAVAVEREGVIRRIRRKTGSLGLSHVGKNPVRDSTVLALLMKVDQSEILTSGPLLICSAPLLQAGEVGFGVQRKKG